MKVFLTETDKLCTINAVDTLEKCIDAVDKIKGQIPNAQFGWTSTWIHQPKGCFVFVGNGSYKEKVFFNEHHTGSSNIHSRHVCEHTGTIYMKILHLV